jgi:SAM-dependent methyltransferase
MPPTASPYDSIAGMYHALWFDWYLPAAMPALEKLFFSQVKPGASVLDVCCGSGHVTKELVKRRYRVTGVDQSAELIALARQQLPDTEFHIQDVCSLALHEKYSAALCTFDSLNHILTLADLQSAFRHIRSALESGGRFVFDMNLHEAYNLDLKQWAVDLHDNSVGLVRGHYDPVERRARTELMWFARSPTDRNCWQQRHSIVEQQCYTRDEIIGALYAAGFHTLETAMATDLGVDRDLGFGRLFVSASG